MVYGSKDKLRSTTNRWNRARVVGIAILLAVVGYYSFQSTSICVPESGPLLQTLFGNDNLQKQSKFWCYDDGLPWSAQEMMDEIGSFTELYDTRPLGRKIGGMGFDHSFYLWFTLKKLQPSFIVESGIFEGHTTWLIKQACPKAQVISMDPNDLLKQRFDGVTYLTGENFSDFNSIPWSTYDFSPENSFVLFDDHQSGLRRAMEAYSHGFGHVMFDDNFFGTTGDNYSLRKICDPRFEVKYTDSFGTITKDISQNTRNAHNRMMRQLFKGYHEFPPMLSTKVSGCQTFQDEQAKPALLQKDADVSNLLEKVPLEFLQGYYYMCYVTLNNH